MNINKYYLEIAKTVAMRSPCLKKHYGAVIVNNGEIISTGYNGNPRGEGHCKVCTKLNHGKNMSDYKECPAVHAEMNALLSSARRDMLGGTLYLSCVRAGGEFQVAKPCEICLRLIKNSGINEVINSEGVLYRRDQDGILRPVKEADND